MNILVVGLNHKSAPISVRESISFPETIEPLQALMKVDHVEEGMILSTCNRVELSVATQETEAASGSLIHFLSHYHDLQKEMLSPHLYCFSGQEAVHHAFRVTASLDSMVIGEPQILGQVKDAYHRAKDADTLGPVLHRFYHKAFSVAKRVRKETDIGAENISVASVAVDLTERVFDRFENKTVLLIGAGEMIEKAVVRLLEKGVKRFFVANRTHDHAEALVRALHHSEGSIFQTISLTEFPKILSQVDLIMVSTASSDYLLTAPMVKKALYDRKQNPILCIDLSVPRNIDPAIHDLDNAYLYDIDDLSQIIADNTKKRETAALAAELIVKEDAQSFYQWLSTLKFMPTLKMIREKIEMARSEELNTLYEYLPNLSEKDRNHIEKFSERFTNRVLHDPLMVIKEEAKQNNIRFVEFLRTLFRLP